MFKDIIKQLRKEKKLTQKEFANLIAVSRGVVNWYERGERIPNINVLIKISKLFNVSADYLLGLSKCPNLNVEEWQLKLLNKNEELKQKLSAIKEILKEK